MLLYGYYHHGGCQPIEWTINRPSVTGLLMHLNVAAIITDDIKQALKYRKRK